MPGSHLLRSTTVSDVARERLLDGDRGFLVSVAEEMGIDVERHCRTVMADSPAHGDHIDVCCDSWPTMTHDYKRHGTTRLFAALDELEGGVTGQCTARRRHQEFIRFLNKINRKTPAGRNFFNLVQIVDENGQRARR